VSDWAVGDLAVCVKDGAWEFEQCSAPSDVEDKGPRKGQMLRVSDVVQMRGEIWLHFPDFDWCDVYLHSRFRKILPDKHEACESEFVTLLKRSKVSA
jgi:hypothetical protein